MSSRIDRYLDGSWQYMLPTAMGKSAHIILKDRSIIKGKLKHITDTDLAIGTRGRKIVTIAIDKIQEIHLEHKANW
jgi:ribosome maturation factor RimP